MWRSYQFEAGDGERVISSLSGLRPIPRCGRLRGLVGARLFERWWSARDHRTSGSSSALWRVSGVTCSAAFVGRVALAERLPTPNFHRGSGSVAKDEEACGGLEYGAKWLGRGEGEGVWTSAAGSDWYSRSACAAISITSGETGNVGEGMKSWKRKRARGARSIRSVAVAEHHMVVNMDISSALPTSHGLISCERWPGSWCHECEQRSVHLITNAAKEVRGWHVYV